MIAFILAVIAVLAFGWIRQSPSARDAVLLAIAAPLLAYFIFREVPVAVPGAGPLREITIEFLDQLVVPLGLVVPPVGVATVLAVVSVVRGQLKDYPTRNVLYDGAAKTAALLICATIGRAMVHSVDGSAGYIFAVLVGVPAFYLITWVAVLAPVPRGGIESPVGLLRLSLSTLPLQVVLGVAAVLTYRAGEYEASAAIVLLPVVLIEFLRRYALANIQLQKRNRERDDFLRLLIEAGDHQRRLLAGDVHDGPLQTVLASRMWLEDVEGEIRSPAARARAEQVRADLAEAADQLRILMRGLSPQPVLELGLKAALDREYELFSLQFPAGLNIECHLNERFDPSLEVLIYRVVHEGLVNASRHAGAQRASVSVESLAATIHVLVADDGKGFSADESEAAFQQGHLGLATLRERVALAGGQFVVGPGSAGGTALAVELPRGLQRQREPRPEWLPRSLDDGLAGDPAESLPSSGR